MFQVFELNSIEELSTYRLSWQDLWNRGRSGRFQLSLPWLETYWKHHSDSRQLKVLVASLAGRVIGILPLVTKKVETRLGNLKVLTYPLDGWGAWFGPVGPNSAATLSAGFRYLSKSSKGWNLLDLSYTDRDRLDLGRTVTAGRNMGWSQIERIWQSVPYIKLEKSWSEYLETRSSSSTDQIFAAEKEALSLGRIALKHYRSERPNAVELSELLDHWKEIAEASKELPIQLAMAEAANESQVLDLSILTINGKPVSGTLGFTHPHGIEIVKQVASEEYFSGHDRHVIESIHLGRLLEQFHLLGDSTVEISPGCSFSTCAWKPWVSKVLSSYRYSSAPLSHVRSALLVKYHLATEKRVSQKRKMEPLQSRGRAEKPEVNHPDPAQKKTGTSGQKVEPPKLKIFQ